MTIQALKALARTKLEEASALAKTAEDAGRDFTGDERTKVKALVDEATDLKARADRLSHETGEAELRAQIDEIGSMLGGARSGFHRDGAWGMAARRELAGRKTLTPSGSITVPSLSAGIITTADRPRSVLQLIPFVGLDGTDTFEYLQEITRDHNAQTVKAGHVKPTSVYELLKVSDRVHTIAHLSEPLDRNLFSDVPIVVEYLEGALRVGCMLELEDQVVNGNGSTVGGLDDLVGIRNTSGLQLQAWNTDRLTTARKAVTVLEDENLEPGGFAFAMSPAEWETYELLKNTDHFVLGDASTGGRAAPPVDRAARRLWGYPVVVTTVIADGIALLGDWRGSAVVREREGVTIEWSEAPLVALDESGGATATAWTVNQRVWRAEGRWGLAVTRPSAFIQIDLTP